MVEMISRKKWDAIVQEWETIGPAYQIPRRSEAKLKFFLDNAIKYMEGKNVLEIGCNAGIFGYHIAQVAQTYTGLEPGNLLKHPKCSKKEREERLRKNPPKTDYFEQALITKLYMPDNSVFVNRTITDFIEHREKYKYDTFFACYALYHFTNSELSRLCEYIWPECDTVIIQTRHQDRPTRHNKYKFYKPEKVKRFFESLGFKVQHLVPVVRAKMADFSIQICQR